MESKVRLRNMLSHSAALGNILLRVEIHRGNVKQSKRKRKTCSNHQSFGVLWVKSGDGAAESYQKPDTKLRFPVAHWMIELKNQRRKIQQQKPKIKRATRKIFYAVCHFHHPGLFSLSLAS